jgi:V8-like Glu-specific endopeptidase
MILLVILLAFTVSAHAAANPWDSTYMTTEGNVSTVDDGNYIEQYNDSSASPESNPFFGEGPLTTNPDSAESLGLLGGQMNIYKRVHQKDTSRHPYQVMGQIEFKTESGESGIFSGTLVGPHHVLTAGLGNPVESQMSY